MNLRSPVLQQKDMEEESARESTTSSDSPSVDEIWKRQRISGGDTTDDELVTSSWKKRPTKTRSVQKVSHARREVVEQTGEFALLLREASAYGC